jgi:hypothetical protein
VRSVGVRGACVSDCIVSALVSARQGVQVCWTAAMLLGLAMLSTRVCLFVKKCVSLVTDDGGVRAEFLVWRSAVQRLKSE